MIHFTNFGWPWCYPRSRFETFDNHYDRDKDQGYPNHLSLEFWVWILEVKVNFILDGLGIPDEKNEIYRHQNHSSSIKWFEILVIFVFQELFCYFYLYCDVNESNGAKNIRRLEILIFGMQSILSFMLYPMVGIGLGDLWILEFNKSSSLACPNPFLSMKKLTSEQRSKYGAATRSEDRIKESGFALNSNVQQKAVSDYWLKYIIT